MVSYQLILKLTAINKMKEVEYFSQCLESLYLGG